MLQRLCLDLREFEVGKEVANFQLRARLLHTITHNGCAVQLMEDWRGWDRLRRTPSHLHETPRSGCRSVLGGGVGEGVGSGDASAAATSAAATSAAAASAAAEARAEERSQWGLPESQVRQLLFQNDNHLLETLANLLESSESRSSFRCSALSPAAS